MEVNNAINENDEFSIWEDIYVDFCKSIFKEHLPDTKIIEVYATEVYDRLFLHVDGADYIIRMWNLTSRNIDWTLYKEVPDSDGGSHGEEICEGFYKIPSSIDAASALDDSKWERFKNVPFFEKTGCNKVILVNNASDLAFDDDFLNPDTIYFDGIDNCCTDGGLDDFTSSDIVLFKKDSLVETLEWCLEHPEFNDFMSEDEIQEWAEKKPWKKTKGTVDEIISRMVLAQNFGDDELFSMDFKIHGEASTEKVEELFIFLGRAQMCLKYIYISVDLKETDCNKIAFNSDKYFVQHFVKEAYGYSIVLPTSLAELQEGIFSKAFSVKCDSPEFVIKGNSIMNKDQTKVITSWEPENKNSSVADSENKRSKSYDYDWKLLEDKALFELSCGYVNKARWVDDVYDFKGEELGEEDVLFFDGTNSYFYMPDEDFPEIYDFDPEPIICFLKNHKRTTLDCCIENNTVDQIMTKSELQDWINEDPWKQKDVDIDELISMLILNHISWLYGNHSEGDGDKPKWNFSVHGEVTTKKLDVLFEMIHSYCDYDPDPCWLMKLDLTDVKGLKEINWDLEGLRVILPSTVTKIKDGALTETFRFTCNSPEFVVVNNLLLNKEKSKVISAINWGNTSSIPDYVAEIADNAFKLSKDNPSFIPENIKKLGKGSFCLSKWKDEKLVIPETIEEIPEKCFAYCDLKKLILPKTLKSIGKEAFYRNNLKKVIVPENCQIEEDAFDSAVKVIRLKPEDFPKIKYPKKKKVPAIEWSKLEDLLKLLKDNNIPLLDKYGSKASIVDDVFSLREEVIKSDDPYDFDGLYFDGSYNCYNGCDITNFSPEEVFVITKDYKLITLSELIETNNLQLKTEDEVLFILDYSGYFWEIDIKKLPNMLKKKDNFYKFKNFILFDDLGTKLDIVENVFPLSEKEIDYDRSYFDGITILLGDYYDDASFDGIYGITKSGKRISLSEALKKNDFSLMNEEELESWLTEKPWKKPLDIDQALALIFIFTSCDYTHYIFNDTGVTEFKLNGKLPAKKLKELISLTNHLVESFDYFDFDEGDDYIEKIRLVLPKGCKVPEIEFDESVEIIYSDDMKMHISHILKK